MGIKVENRGINKVHTHCEGGGVKNSEKNSGRAFWMAPYLLG